MSSHYQCHHFINVNTLSMSTHYQCHHIINVVIFSISSDFEFKLPIRNICGVNKMNAINYCYRLVRSRIVNDNSTKNWFLLNFRIFSN
jgi:hypothetical protein